MDAMGRGLARIDRRAGLYVLALAAAGLAVGMGLKTLGVRHAAPAMLAPLLFAPPLFSSTLHAWIRGKPCPGGEALRYRTMGLAGLLGSVVVNAR